MRKPLLATAATVAFLAGTGLALAQSVTTTNTTTWTNEEGTTIRQYSQTQHEQSFSDPGFAPTVGAELPTTVTIYPLPQTVQVPDPQQYSYTIINNRPVVVERTTRRVIHIW